MNSPRIIHKRIHRDASFVYRCSHQECGHLRPGDLTCTVVVWECLPYSYFDAVAWQRHMLLTLHMMAKGRFAVARTRAKSQQDLNTTRERHIGHFPWV